MYGQVSSICYRIGQLLVFCHSLTFHLLSMFDSTYASMRSQILKQVVHRTGTARTLARFVHYVKILSFSGNLHAVNIGLSSSYSVHLSNVIRTQQINRQSITPYRQSIESFDHAGDCISCELCLISSSSCNPNCSPADSEHRSLSKIFRHCTTVTTTYVTVIDWPISSIRLRTPNPSPCAPDCVTLGPYL